jgi:hypothetical protein
MDSSQKLIVSIQNGNIILKPFNSYFKYEENIIKNNSFTDEHLNISFENYQNLFSDSENIILGNNYNMNINNKKNQLIFTNFLKKNWRDEIRNIKNKILDKYIFEKFPF